MKSILLSLFVSITCIAFAQSTYQFAVLKYNGGGDYYSNPTSIPNLVAYCNEELDMNINEDVPFVEVGSPELLNYPFVHMTGHGNVVFSSAEIENVRAYLEGGGFLHISDNYGMDQFVRPMMRKVFPELEFVELPFSHPIYHQRYDLNAGLPKVHEHDNEKPQGLGLLWKGRLVCFYDFECDLGDGWEDTDVHNDSEEVRKKAMQMGANLVQYVLMGDQ